MIDARDDGVSEWAASRRAASEAGGAVDLQSIANSRNTLGMFGSGYIEMLARQITSDLQAIRDALPAGRSVDLISKGLSFGRLTRAADGTWDTSRVTGLQASSLAGSPPNLIVRPFHEAGAVISLRRFTNNAMNHHHGIQWVFSEPNPFNPTGNRRPADGPIYEVNLNSPLLPSPRLEANRGVVWVPAFTDLRLHDICDGDDDPNIEPIDMHAPPNSEAFFAGNRRFITRKLWGTANEPPYFHHGQYTTLREAVLAHGGEAASVRALQRLVRRRAGRRYRIPENAAGAAAGNPGTGRRRARPPAELEFDLLDEAGRRSATDQHSA